MANMSYCRFQNTLSDLKDCAPLLREDLSSDEYAAMMQLVILCREITDEMED